MKTYSYNLFIFSFLLFSCHSNTHVEEKEKDKLETEVTNAESLDDSYHQSYLKEIMAIPQRSSETDDLTNMVLVEGGDYMMGGLSNQSRKDEFPRHEESVDSFWMDKYEVTNKEFAAFIEATGYVTTAERTIIIEGKEYQAGALVFDPSNPQMWWRFEEGANWKHPSGPDSNIDGKENHPVVQVSWYDAFAYAHWARKRLPKEQEWEFAARANQKDRIYFWGNEFSEAIKNTNFFQGSFPVKNEVLDQFEKTAAVGSFPKNAIGLYDIAGNVWEWCLDTYYPNAYQILDQRTEKYFKSYYNPEQQKVVRGGSFLCSEQYCTGYRIAARMSSTPDSGLEHTGFRCVMDYTAKN